jgi:hypothetical protein
LNYKFKRNSRRRIVPGTFGLAPCSRSNVTISRALLCKKKSN